jgi:hypothetical protein
MSLTIRKEELGQHVVSKDGAPVADIIVPAVGGGLIVTMFGPTPGGMSKRVDDMAEAKELIEAAVG